MTTLVTLPKVKGRIGLTICGGSPYYSSIFVADVHLKTEADKCGKIWAGDEIVAVNGCSILGSGKAYVARLVKDNDTKVTLEIRRWKVEDESKGLDIAAKALKHRVLEKMPSGVVDGLGFCHAVLANDKLQPQLERLTRMTQFCKDFSYRLRLLLDDLHALVGVHTDIGNAFSGLAPFERQSEVSTALSEVARNLRNIGLTGEECVQDCRKVLSSVHTLIAKALPDTQLTIQKYADKKFEYLAYCLKAYELERAEEENFAECEPWNGVYLAWEKEYRDVVRLRHAHRMLFNRARAVVFEKIRMLEMKLTQDLPVHMETVAEALGAFYKKAAEHSQGVVDVFPIPCTIEWNYITTQYVEQQLATMDLNGSSSTSSSESVNSSSPPE